MRWRRRARDSLLRHGQLGGSGFNTTGAPIALNLTKDGLNQKVDATCAYADGTTVKKTFTVSIASHDYNVYIVGPKKIASGNEAAFLVLPGNLGPAASGPVTVQIMVPSGLSITSVQPAWGGNCPTTGQVVTCTVPGLTVADSTKPIRINTKAMGGAGTTQTLKAEINPGGVLPELIMNNNVATYDMQVVAQRPDLTVDLTGPARVSLGQNVEMELRVRGLNDTDASNVAVSVVLPAGFTYQSTLQPGSCTISGTVLTCLFINIPGNGSDYVNITAKATAPAALLVTVATLDPNNAVQETDESNNLISLIMRAM